VESPLALYRRYRPETFAEMIGQEHVTGPLRAALAANRVNHAYLFSGPRGCGKTTSARILARALNCEKAPIADPCGECDSCRDLRRGGPGSIDVIEIDAASHGGVDDARDLREKAFFAPVRSRYKVYIIDEAHMVSPQGFNALLKLVEEPPEHLRFIFATTEPEKVIPTIRSRTHHYPFRLYPPKLVADYIATLCEKEGIPVEPAALPLIARAGAGSMRDSLSVMDQLLGGAGPEGVTYAVAAGLLGYTPDTLLDEVVDAFAAGDGASVFSVVDKVIETGQDPRRFAEDLLRRLRDLVIISAVPDAPATGLIDVAEDAGERLAQQATRFGAHELTRAADIVAAGLTEMRGATAPRLLLELLCARVLLPGADHDVNGLGARLDRLERRLAIGSLPPAATPDEPHAPSGATTISAAPTELPPGPAQKSAPPRQQDSSDVAAGSVIEPPLQPSTEPPVEPVAAESQSAAPVEPAPVAPVGGLSLMDVRRIWPDIVEETKKRRRVAWIHLTQNAQVVGFEGDVLTLGFANAGTREAFANGGHGDVVRDAANAVVGVTWKIEAIVAPGTAPSAAPPPPTPEPAAYEPTPPPAAPVAQPSRPTPPPAPEPVSPEAADDAADPDDQPLDETSGEELLARELGASLIDEIPNG